MSRIAGRYIFLGGMVVGAGTAVPLTVWCMNRNKQPVIQPVDLSNGRLRVRNGPSAASRAAGYGELVKKAYQDYMDASKGAQKALSQRLDTLARGPRSIAELEAANDPETMELFARELNIMNTHGRLAGLILTMAAELALAEAQMLGENHPQAQQKAEHYVLLHQSGLRNMFVADAAVAWANNPSFDVEKVLDCVLKVDFLRMRWSYGFNGEVPAEMDIPHSTMSTGYRLHDKSWADRATVKDEETDIKWITMFEREYRCFGDAVEERE